VILDWIELRSFRSYAHLEFAPHPGTNLLVGVNGAGKTNLLEAISYLSTLRSLRRAPDQALIAVGADSAILRSGITGPVSAHTIEIEVPAGGRRRVQLDGKRPGRNAELLSRLRCVTFLPDDLEIVKGSAGQRRDLLDDLAAQLRPAAAADRAHFERAVRQRNSLLRTDGPSANEHALAGFEETIARAGARVVVHRRSAAAAMTPYLAAAYAELGQEKVTWSYESTWGEWDADEPTLTAMLRQVLASGRRRDMERRTTTRGPHRDEPHLWLDERDSRTHASQGEQRSLVLALRLASFDVLRATFDEAPVLLLDDVFSELDPQRAAAVVERLPSAQAFLTSARRDDVGAVDGKTWSVESAGKVVPI
jgi:DNA replication and repair protein RecF